MRAKAKKTPMCSVSLIAIELKGLAAPGEALKFEDYQVCRISSALLTTSVRISTKTNAMQRHGLPPR